MDEQKALEFLKNTSTSPGVYQMFDKNQKLLYVGKAKNLKNRLASYFRQSNLNIKTSALMQKVANIQTIITKNETEALLLEQNIIKQERPNFNILLRDDKSYPFIVFSQDKFPALMFRRKQANFNDGNWFGPYTSASAVKQSISLIQKTFKIRTCSKNAFKNRSRPCLQYQIDRCTAPCVGKISAEDYSEDVKSASLFLTGKNQILIKNLASSMEKAAAKLEFEKAQAFRDKIIAITKMQSAQGVDVQKGEADVFAILKKEAIFALAIVFIREGRLIQTRLYIIDNKLELSASQVLTNSIEAFYFQNAKLNIGFPDEIISNIKVENPQELSVALSENFGKKVQIKVNVRAPKTSWLDLAKENAKEHLLNNWRKNLNNRERIEDLSQLLNKEVELLECFDISHTQGAQTVASCVVFNRDGADKKSYRKFNIDDITPGDDYAAMQQVLKRRYSRQKKSGAKLPDLLIVDGGKGQLNSARKILQEIGADDILLLGVAKGTSRKAGLETLFLEKSDKGIILPINSPSLHLIQHIRDEAHRFAISSHRNKRTKASFASGLEEIAGIGAKRRKALLRHFGSIKEIMEADAESLARVDGISEKLAQEITNYFKN